MAYGAGKGYRGGKSGTGQGSRPQHVDKLCIVTGYDLESNVIKCTDVEDGKVIAAHVDPAAIARNVPSEERNPSAAFFGHRIDKRMEKNIPIGHRIALERAESVRKLTKDGVETHMYKVQRVHHIKDKRADKSMVALVTMSAKDGRVRDFQTWNEVSINAADPESVEVFAAKLDAVNDEYAKAQAELGEEGRPAVLQLGVQFRALIPGETPAELMVVDTSVPMDYIYPVKENGTVVVPGRIYDRAKLMEDIEGYTAHIKDAFPDARVEFNTYTNYWASRRSDSFELTERNRYDSMVVMTSTPTKLSLTDEEPEIGKNWACRGILVLASDKLSEAEDGTPIREKRNMVNRAFVNSTFKGNVNAFIRSSDGKKCVMHPDLRRQLNKDAAAKPAEAPSDGQQGSDYTPPAQNGNTGGAPGSNPWDDDDIPMHMDTPPVQPPADEPPATESAPSTPTETAPADGGEKAVADRLEQAATKLGGKQRW